MGVPVDSARLLPCPSLPCACSGSEEQQHLLASVKHLELELSSLRARMSDWPDSQSGCLEGDALQEKVGEPRPYLFVP